MIIYLLPAGTLCLHFLKKTEIDLHVFFLALVSLFLHIGRQQRGRKRNMIMKFYNIALLLFLNEKTSAFTAPSSVRFLNNGARAAELTNSITHHNNNNNNNNALSVVPPGTEVNGESSSVPHIRLNVNEKARTVTSVCTSGTLCSVSTHDGIEGAPFGSYVDYVLDDEGNPVLLMNEMSMHTINIRDNADSEKGMGMVTLFTQLSGNGQAVSRCSLTGKIVKIDAEEADDIDTIRMRYSIVHVYADQVMDSPKFDFYRLIPEKIYFVGGFGVLAKWVDPEEYQHSTPDILAKEAATICAKLNADHDEDLQLTARHLLDVDTEIERVRVTNVDRLGMDIRVTSQKGARRNKLTTNEFRVGFRIPVISVEDAKSEVLKVFQEAWEKGNGYVWDAIETDTELPGAGIPIAKIAEDGLI